MKHKIVTDGTNKISDLQIKNEFQYKYPIKNKSVLLASLAANGIEIKGPTRHAYTYFRDPANHKNTFIRIKEDITKGTASIDCKLRNEITGQRDRFETPISSPEQMKQILIGVGCTLVVTFEKDRHTCKKDFVRLDIDDLSYRDGQSIKPLGIFLEVKFMEQNNEQVFALLKKLGIEPNDFDKRSVVEVYEDSLH